MSLEEGGEKPEVPKAFACGITGALLYYEIRGLKQKDNEFLAGKHQLSETSGKPGASFQGWQLLILSSQFPALDFLTGA